MSSISLMTDFLEENYSALCEPVYNSKWVACLMDFLEVLLNLSSFITLWLTSCKVRMNVALGLDKDLLTKSFFLILKVWNSAQLALQKDWISVMLDCLFSCFDPWSVAYILLNQERCTYTYTYCDLRMLFSHNIKLSFLLGHATNHKQAWFTSWKMKSSVLKKLSFLRAK